MESFYSLKERDLKNNWRRNWFFWLALGLAGLGAGLLGLQGNGPLRAKRVGEQGEPYLSMYYLDTMEKSTKSPEKKPPQWPPPLPPPRFICINCCSAATYGPFLYLFCTYRRKYSYTYSYNIVTKYSYRYSYKT